MTSYKTIFTLVLVLALGLMFGCGGGATNANKTAPANNAPANKPANTAPANNTSSSNSDKSDNKMGNKDLDFTLVNKTGYAIKAVSIGPAGDADWHPEDEVLKGQKFGDGAELKITFSPKATSAKWDLKIDWEDGDPSVEWTNVDITTVKKLTLKYDKASGVTSIE